MTQGALAQHIRPLLQSCNTALEGEIWLEVDDHQTVQVSPFPEAKPFVVDVDDDLPVRQQRVARSLPPIHTKV
jgi:hypothetical protein